MPEGITSLPVNRIIYKVNVNQWVRFKLNIEKKFFFKEWKKRNRKAERNQWWELYTYIFLEYFRVSSYLAFVPVTAAISRDFVHSY